MSKLVAYFTASGAGVTAGVAERLAGVTGAALYEIRPETPYTAADIDWRDKTSRSTVEMNDPDCRPALADREAPVADADTVFVGFPVWWYREPSIVDTFLEAYDFSGKTIVPFCTSGSSGIGDTYKRIAEIAKGAKVLHGERFAANVSADELKKWAESL